MLDAPRIYRPVSALADYTEIIRHRHAHVGYRSRALPGGAITLIIDVGRRQQPCGCWARGRPAPAARPMSAIPTRPNSVLLYDVIGKALLEAPFLQNTIEFMQKLGAPWVFGSETPGTLVEGRGWAATVTDMAVPGNAWKRWEHPAIPADVPEAPRGYFVEAVKP